MSTVLSAWDTVAAGLLPREHKYATPGELARAIEPATIQTPALDLIDSKIVEVESGEIDRLIISMPPQEGKSTRVTTIGPTWCLERNPDRRIAIVSYGQDLADEFGGAVRNHITANSGEDGTLDLGLRIAPDNGAVRRWRVAGRRGGVRSVGLQGGLTGRPADMLFIDDPIANSEQASSIKYRDRAWAFWQAVGGTRLAPGAPVVLILTRWHEDDLAGRLLAAPDGHRWTVINIPAQADHDPNKGETDPLGREPGEFMQSARTNERTGKTRTPEEWEQIKVQAGSRVWNALYQGRPAPVEGDMFKREQWGSYSNPQWLDMPDGSRWLTHYDDLLISWDMAFKDTEGSDFVVGQVWMRRGADIYLLDQVRDRMDFVTTCARFRELAARWPQATLKLVEDKANGTAVINALRRIVQGIVPDEPQGSKVARASAVTPLVEARNVHLPAPELCPWVADFIEEAAAFPNGAHDDQVDAMSQALNRLILAPLREDETRTEPEEFEEYDARGYAISPL
jgi:predicted phage terminase large subunit-like protein